MAVSIRHIRRLVAERRVPYLKDGWLVRFDPAEIAAWLDGSRHPKHPECG
jgi:excisionase family DNA binding protein